MRQAIGSTWVMQLVIIFMLIFVAFLALTINFTKAFKIKNELITIVEKHEGLSNGKDGSIELINNYLRYNGYGVLGHCEENEYGIPSLESANLEISESNKKYYYCVRRESASITGLPDRSRYHMRIFFHFSLPVIGDLFTFSSDGTTININYPVKDIEYT